MFFGALSKYKDSTQSQQNASHGNVFSMTIVTFLFIILKRVF